MTLRLRAVAAATVLLASTVLHAQPAKWAEQAKRVTIMRDEWGVAHVYGKSDADAVFGMIYAQAEDDFNRVETNYINALGRLAEVDGERELWRDLRMKLFIDTLELKKLYVSSPAWLQALMVGWSDGLNYYLSTHPQVKPRLITTFAPWMALAFSEGSIGGDIESVNLRNLEQFYGPRSATPAPSRNDDATSAPFGEEPGGSNGFAVAPQNTVNGRALLMINPHTSFYFRPEIHMVSEEGLNAYGAVTWGQFFIYQGFNSRLGWMHTSGGGDVIDEYLETVTPKGKRWTYKYGTGTRAVTSKVIRLPYKTATGMAEKVITAYFTHHGPVIRMDGAQWVAVKMMNNPLDAIQQSYGRTKATNYETFKQVMALRTNSSNNTVYADADGVIAYFHGNFIPKRNAGIDFTKPVDGSNPRTEWQGLHALDEMITLKNPATGWLVNTNNWPFTASGASSPTASEWPVYMSAQREDNARGVHAVRVLQNRKDFTVEGLIGAAYDSYLPAMEQLIPPVIAAYDALPSDDPLRAKLAVQVRTLRAWDYRFGVASVAMTLANAYGEQVTMSSASAAREAGVPVLDYIATKAQPAAVLTALAAASERLDRDFGSWQTPWGDVNRFQRLNGDINGTFDDSKPSLPVAFASANWGSLAAYGQTGQRTTKKYYGNRGNSFVAAVEFGPRIRAKSVLAGGVNADPNSPYFFNQGERYATGQFKDVNFYREDVEKHAVRTYQPGQ
ncbi:penicillin acylase family protein [Gemmatimonas sp.]|uniref:penicillin acylase family protein n=1 Tax=Gemmatimonas sp. TaxID=1962908 RepID=UPI003F7008D1